MKFTNFVCIAAATCWVIWNAGSAYGNEPGATETRNWSWQRAAGEKIALHGPGGVVWQFNFGPRLTKPFFHPVALPGGGPLTASRPPDHAWHYGLWFSWKFINGVNYWEEPQPTGLPEGTTAWDEVVARLQPDGSASIAMELTYRVPPADPVLKEQRQLIISHPQVDGRYHIDWTSVFRAGSAGVVLDRTPIPPHPQGKPWGGYAGLSIRLSPGLTERRVSTTEGDVHFQTDGVHRSGGRGCAYHGLLGDRACGMTILDHPDNPRHPSPWYAIRSEMSYLNAALLTHRPLSIDAGETLKLQYRICVHPGRWNADAVKAAWRQYTKTSLSESGKSGRS